MGTPGNFIDGLTERDYADLPGIRSSEVRRLSKSPRHYRYYEPGKPTAAMLLGLQVHCLVLEEEAYPQRFVTVNVGSRNAKLYKETVAELKPGQHAVLQSEKGQAKMIADFIRAHPEAGPLLAGCIPERTWTWVDEPTGIRCKVRSDGYCEGSNTLLELKTTSDLDYHALQRQFQKFGYFQQLAFYEDGITAVVRERPQIFAIVAETKPPYDVGALKIVNTDLEYGRTENQRALELYASLEGGDHWPGRYPSIEPLRIPSWAAVDDEESDLGISVGGEAV